MWNRRSVMKGLAASTLAPVALSAATARAESISEAQILVERARLTALTLLGDPQYGSLKRLLQRAKGVLILPNVIQAGFFFGGGGGLGVLVARGADGVWSGPAFYSMAEASFGLQFGGQQSQMMLVIMSDKGLSAVMDRSVKLGADAKVAMGELGTQIGAGYGAGVDADMYAYAKTAGLFGGLAVDGSVISPRTEWNDVFYGQVTTPEQILLDRAFSRPEAQALAQALATQ